MNGIGSGYTIGSGDTIGSRDTIGSEDTIWSMETIRSTVWDRSGHLAIILGYRANTIPGIMTSAIASVTLYCPFSWVV